MADENTNPSLETQESTSENSKEKTLTTSQVEEMFKQRTKSTQEQLARERTEKEQLRQELETLKSSTATSNLQNGKVAPEDIEHALNEEAHRRALPLAEQIAKNKIEEKSIGSLKEKFEKAAEADPELMELSKAPKGKPLAEFIPTELAKMDYISNPVAILKHLLKDPADSDMVNSASSPAEFKRIVNEISQKLSKNMPGPSKYQSDEKLTSSMPGTPDDDDDNAKAKKFGQSYGW